MSGIVRNIRVLFIAAAFLLSAFADVIAQEKFKVANVLQSNMVVQQNKKMKVWGNAPEGSMVTIKVDWNEKPVTVYADADRKWLAEVKVPKVNKGDYSTHSIIFVNKEDTLKLNNILIGEVWLCSGQSNMEMTMKPAPPWHKGVINNEEEIAKANYPNIRLFKVPRDTSSKLEPEVRGDWKECSPASVADFSGVAYYFAREVQQKIDIPVGLVLASYGGASCQAFTSRTVLSADQELKTKYLDPFDAAPSAKDIIARPTLMYNRMIYPLRNLSLAGILWYQGESNSKDKLYTKLCTAMFEGWKEDFQQNDLPFYFVQMTPYNWKSDNFYEDFYAYFRESQQAMLKVKNTGMAVTMDVGEPDNIHPQRKKEVGERLAQVALHKTYGFNVIYEGPRLRKTVPRGSEIEIKYKRRSLGKGLSTNDGNPPKYFYIAGEDGVFFEAAARVMGDRIILRSTSVRKPVMVRYAFLNSAVTNLINKDGLPAVPFRTDRLERVVYK